MSGSDRQGKEKISTSDVSSRKQKYLTCCMCFEGKFAISIVLVMCILIGLIKLVLNAWHLSHMALELHNGLSVLGGCLLFIAAFFLFLANFFHRSCFFWPAMTLLAICLCLVVVIITVLSIDQVRLRTGKFGRYDSEIELVSFIGYLMMYSIEFLIEAYFLYFTFKAQRLFEYI